MGSNRAVITPTLFSKTFSVMLMDAFQDSVTGFPHRCRFDGNIFNPRSLQAKTKVQTVVIDEPLYHMAKNASSEEKFKEPWIKSHSHVITMFSQSAQKD